MTELATETVANLIRFASQGQKMQLIKEVRALQGLDLQEAKDFVEAHLEVKPIPSTLFEEQLKDAIEVLENDRDELKENVLELTDQLKAAADNCSDYRAEYFRVCCKLNNLLETMREPGGNVPGWA